MAKRKAITIAGPTPRKKQKSKEPLVVEEAERPSSEITDPTSPHSDEGGIQRFGQETQLTQRSNDSGEYYDAEKIVREGKDKYYIKWHPRFTPQHTWEYKHYANELLIAEWERGRPERERKEAEKQKRESKRQAKEAARLLKEAEERQRKQQEREERIRRRGQAHIGTEVAPSSSGRRRSVKDRGGSEVIDSPAVSRTSSVVPHTSNQESAARSPEVNSAAIELATDIEEPEESRGLDFAAIEIPQQSNFHRSQYQHIPPTQQVDDSEQSSSSPVRVSAASDTLITPRRPTPPSLVLDTEVPNSDSFIPSIEKPASAPAVTHSTSGSSSSSSRADSPIEEISQFYPSSAPVRGTVTVSEEEQSQLPTEIPPVVISSTAPEDSLVSKSTDLGVRPLCSDEIRTITAQEEVAAKDGISAEATARPKSADHVVESRSVEIGETAAFPDQEEYIIPQSSFPPPGEESAIPRQETAHGNAFEQGLEESAGVSPPASTGPAAVESQVRLSQILVQPPHSYNQNDRESRQTQESTTEDTNTTSTVPDLVGQDAPQSEEIQDKVQANTSKERLVTNGDSSQDTEYEVSFVRKRSRPTAATSGGQPTSSETWQERQVVQPSQPVTNTQFFSTAVEDLAQTVEKSTTESRTTSNSGNQPPTQPPSVGEETVRLDLAQTENIQSTSESPYSAPFQTQLEVESPQQVNGDRLAPAFAPHNPNQNPPSQAASLPLTQNLSSTPLQPPPTQSPETFNTNVPPQPDSAAISSSMPATPQTGRKRADNHIAERLRAHREKTSPSNGLDDILANMGKGRAERAANRAAKRDTPSGTPQGSPAAESRSSPASVKDPKLSVAPRSSRNTRSGLAAAARSSPVIDRPTPTISPSEPIPVSTDVDDADMAPTSREGPENGPVPHDPGIDASALRETQVTIPSSDGVEVTLLFSEPQLDPEEYVVPVPLASVQGDNYKNQIVFNSERIKKWVEKGFRHDTDDDRAAEAFLDRLRKLCVHMDLDNPDVLTQKGVTSAQQAEWDRTSSTKFRFLADLLDTLGRKSVHRKSVHVIITSRPGHTLGIVQTFLSGLFSRLKMYSSRTDDENMAWQNGQPWVFIRPTSGKGSDFTTEFVSIIIALDNTLDSRKLPEVKRENWEFAPCLVLRLVTSYTVEHVDLSVSSSVTGPERLRGLLFAASQLRDEAKRAHAHEESPSATATLVSDYILRWGSWRATPVPTWPLQPLTSIAHLLPSDPPSQGSTTASETEAPKTHKRKNDNLDVGPTAPTKKLRSTPQPNSGIQPGDVTHISDSVNGTAQQSALDAVAKHHTPLVDTSKPNAAPAVDAAELERTIERERIARTAAQKQARAYEYALAMRQTDYENEREALFNTRNELTAAREEAERIRNLLVTRNAKSEDLRLENIALKDQVKTLQALAESNVVPEIAELARLQREKDEALQAAERADKGKVAAEQRENFMRDQYQSMRSSMDNTLEEHATLQAQVADLTRRADQRVVDLRAASDATAIKTLSSALTKANTELDSVKQLLRRKEEQLKEAIAKAEKFRGGYGMRSSSVPRARSPMPGSRGASPMPGSGSGHEGPGGVGLGIGRGKGSAMKSVMGRVREQ